MSSKTWKLSGTCTAGSSTIQTTAISATYRRARNWNSTWFELRSRQLMPRNQMTPRYYWHSESCNLLSVITSKLLDSLNKLSEKTQQITHSGTSMEQPLLKTWTRPKVWKHTNKHLIWDQITWEQLLILDLLTTTSPILNLQQTVSWTHLFWIQV